MAGLVITVGGPHGTGKSTYARALARILHLRYVSAGELFRETAKAKKISLEEFSKLAAEDPTIDMMIDEATKTEAKKGDVVIDAQLGAWMAGKLADVKLLLVAPKEIRFARIAHRDHCSIATAKKETLTREDIQKQRYKKYYGIDVSDINLYDLKIDTGLYSIEKTTSIIVEEVRKQLVSRKVKGS